jgi:serine/threonine-protein kinase
LNRNRPGGFAYNPPVSDATPRAPGSSHPTAALAAEPPPEVKEAAANPANRFGKYVLVRELGHGGMGVVYLAWQSDLRRFVALKFIKGIEGSEDLARFEREARTAAALVHPNIVPVYEVGELDGKHYYSMMLVRGMPLDAHLHGSTPPLRQVVRWIADALAAVHYANEQGVIHRDIKPANLMIGDDGRVYVMDFGLARWNKPGSSLTASGMAVGTPAYMSPEQAAGRVHGLDGRSDVYSFGATLYEVLAGRPPFEGTGISVMMALTTEDPVPPRRLRPDAPADLEVVCLRAMDKDPGRRYGSCGDFAADLRRWLDGEPILAKPAGAVSKIARRIRKHKLLSAALATAAVASFVGLGLFAYAQYAKRTAAESKAELGAFHERSRHLEALRAEVQGFLTRIQRWDLYLYQPEFDITSKDSELEDLIRELETRRPQGPLPELDYAVGTAHRRLQRFERAVECFTAAVTQSPNFAPALYERGLTRIDLLRTRPTGFMGHTTLADLRDRVSIRDSELARGALEDLERAVQLKGISTDDLAFARARIEFHYGRHAEAVAICTEAIDRGSRQAEFYSLRGHLRTGLAMRHPRIREVHAGLLLALEDLRKGADIRRCDADLALWYVWLCEMAAWMDVDSGVDPARWIDEGLRQAARARTIRPRDPEPVFKEIELLSYRLENDLESGRPVPFQQLGDRVAEARRLGAEPANVVHASAFVEVWAARVTLRDGGAPLPALDRAVAAFDEAVRLNPDVAVRGARGAALGVRMRARIEYGGDVEADYKAALADLDALLARFSFDQEALSNRSMIHDTYAEHLVRSMRDPLDPLALAIEDGRRAVEIYPDFATGWSNVAVALLRRARWTRSRGRDPVQDLEAALRALNEALSIQKADPTALGHRAGVRLELAELAASTGRDPGPHVEAALADLDAAIARQPRNHDHRMARGSVHFQVALAEFESGGDPEAPLKSAQSDYAAACEASPRYPVAWMNLGLVHQVRADWLVRRRSDAAAEIDAATAAFRKAVDLNPGYHEARLNLAGTLLTRSDLLAARREDPTKALEEAIAEYTRILKDVPNHGSALNDRGTARNRLGRWLRTNGGDGAAAWKTADADFTAALATNPSEWRWLLNRSTARKHLGRYADAADDIEAAIGINPGLEKSQRPEANRLRRLAEKEHR